MSAPSEGEKKMEIGVAIYGLNGHQILGQLARHPNASLVATAGVNLDQLPESFRGDAAVRHYEYLTDMLNDDRVQLVSLCSPRRSDQAEDAIVSLMSGKHVYAEKPCAMTEPALDAILTAAQVSVKEFHEMAGTAFDQPYLAMRQTVASGVLGTVVQVFAQKSYPYHDRRPQDEEIDGGLVMQAGVHAARYVEHVAGQRIGEVEAIETRLGNPKQGGLRMAAAYMMQLENGGVASIVANYLNQPGMRRWGNEHLRIFGTEGMLESVDGGTQTRLVVGDEDRGEIDASGPAQDYFELFINHLTTGTDMPLTLEEELHPTRVVIRAKSAASRRGL